ncbi:hypothetical protein DFQ29_000764 [Apophysomyces sp. BC1021]|nr:hypothetical protein DFQ29_000764 [Apophysomyces sp. BC1021]
MEPDGYLLSLLRDPQAMDSGPAIRPLDPDTLRDAFSLKEGPIPGFDASILGTDDGGSSTYSVGNTGQYLGIERDMYGMSAGEGDVGGERKHKKKDREHDRSLYRRDENEGETLVVD